MASGGPTAYAQTQVWSSEMTVGVNDQLSYDYLGYINIDEGYFEDTGSLSSKMFEAGGEIVTVSALCHPDFSGDNHYLFFLVDKELPGDGALEVGPNCI